MSASLPSPQPSPLPPRFSRPSRLGPTHHLGCRGHGGYVHHLMLLVRAHCHPFRNGRRRRHRLDQLGWKFSWPGCPRTFPLDEKPPRNGCCSSRSSRHSSLRGHPSPCHYPAKTKLVFDQSDPSPSIVGSLFSVFAPSSRNFSAVPRMFPFFSESFFTADSCAS